LEENTSSRKADLHVHSLYSEVEEGVLKRIIQSESYTPPAEIYRIAKKRGMDFVTITDHNSIKGVLEILHLPDVFISEEVTAKFPEDGCLIHLITLNIDETQHKEIQSLKDNVYELKNYLTSQNIIHFVAHPFSSVNGKLTRKHWEKMLLLFDIFEVKNGVQKEKDNLLLEKILTSLSPEKIEDLANKYNITPSSKTPWIKSMVGGSDDHGGLYIGRTYTLGKGPYLENFLESIREGECRPQGRGGTYSTIGHSIYATGYRFYKDKLNKRKKWRLLDKILDDEKKGKILEKVLLNSSNGERSTHLFPKNFLISLFIKKFSKKMPFLSTLKVLNKLNKNLPFYATLFPYFFGFAYQNKDKNFTREVKRGYLNQNDPLKVAVFTDVVQIGEDLPFRKEIEVLCCRRKKSPSQDGVKFFRSVADFPFPLYPEIHVYIPPLLEVLLYCEQKEFTVLHALTPGPMGIAAIIVSKILKLPIIGTYQIDFPNFLAPSDNSDSFKNIACQYLGWFYNQMNRVVVSSTKYLEQLREKNIPDEKIKVILSGDEFSSKQLLYTTVLSNILKAETFDRLRSIYEEVYAYP